MDQYRINQILRIAKMHYELGMSQIEIAQAEHLSKSTVSRLIKSASDLGIVKISIVEPTHTYTDLESEIISRFHIKKATILPDVVGNKDVLRRDVCSALADDLSRLVEDNNIIGVAWGNTLSTLANVLIPAKRKNVSIFQINGGFSKALYESGAQSIVKSFVDSFNGNGFLLPAPALVDNAVIADHIKEDSSVKRILRLAQNADIAVYSVGIISQSTTLYQMGYFSPEEYEMVRKKAVGDVCSHFINADGQIADVGLDSRVVATPLQVIKKIPLKMVAAIGMEKVKAILACLRGGLADYLYIDQPTASAVLKLDKRN